MEIVAIEKRTFEQMIQRFEDFAKYVHALCGQNRSNENWLDNKQVSDLFKISSRSLQTYRDTGVLPYSQIGRKCYYKTTDIQQFINQQQIKK
ncbi:helix-turn-helix domain-containing protein [Bacteroides ovatus]|uniref:helix-turn-helix domain-containing protein n=1 Tax=Bacteroides ovatus TaxID=28116 RepID=UPI001F23697F|nr:helix-turn-helix domain-containing protein [Bacteroides ovatus]MCE8921497.1 helix-turn-helix domain-containing protein [Bacteroides ovatus]